MHSRFWFTINRLAWRSSNRLLTAGFKIPYTYKRVRGLVLSLSDSLWKCGHVALRKGAHLQ